MIAGGGRRQVAGRRRLQVRRWQPCAWYTLRRLSDTMTIRNYADLIAWQKAMTLAESVYKTTQQLPREERYGLTSQMRRAAVSIPSNIAEGEGRGSDGPVFGQGEEVGWLLNGPMRTAVRNRIKQATEEGLSTPATSGPAPCSHLPLPPPATYFSSLASNGCGSSAIQWRPVSPSRFARITSMFPANSHRS